MTTYTPNANSSTDLNEQQITDTIAAMNGAISKALREGAIAPDVMVRALERALNEAQLSSRPKEQVLFSIGQLIEGYWPHIEKRKATLPTGFKQLDNVLSGGLETKRLKVLLGAPGSGKTTFANQLATNVANSGRPVLYVTSEDSPYTLLAKNIARVGNIPYTAVLKGWTSEKMKIDVAFAGYASQMSAERLLYLDATTGTTMADVADIAQQHFEKYRTAEHGGPGVLVLDYLQRMARTQNQQVKQELRNMVSDLTDKLRSIAGSLDCCVIALASQNRASGYGASNASALASAKESGDIEYTADVIMSIAEDKRDEGGIKRKTVMTEYGTMKPWLLSIDKNRLGQPEAKIELNWFPERQKFGEVEVSPR